MEDRIAGFITGFVTTNSDPIGLHRVRAVIPGFFEPDTPFWIWPGNVPGGGGPSRGSCYPPPEVGARVAIIFEHGIWDASDPHAIYLPGYYGVDSATGEAEGPDSTYGAPTAEEARNRVTLWEDSAFAIYIINSTTEKKFVIKEKKGGSEIVFDAMSGSTKTGSKIRIAARTGLSIAATGLVDIMSAMTVQVMQRRVMRLTDKGI